MLLPKTNRIESEIGSPFSPGSELRSVPELLESRAVDGVVVAASREAHDSVCKGQRRCLEVLQWFLGNSAANSSHKKVRGIRSFYGVLEHKRITPRSSYAIASL